MELKPGYKQTEVGVIPEDWEVQTLGEFIALRRGHDLTDRDRRRGEVPVMGSAGQNGFHDTAIAKGPGVVLGRSGASFGQAHFCEVDFWPHNTALYVTDFHGNNPKFVFYFLKSIDFSRHNSGGAQQSLNRNFIAPIPISLPPTLAEQRAIAEALSDADALTDSLEQLIAKKRNLKQGAMQELLTGKRRLPGFENKLGYKQTEVGELPGDWEVMSLGSFCEIAAGRDLVKGNFSPTDDYRYQFPIYSNALTKKGLYGYSNFYQYEPDKITVTARGDIGHAVYRDTRFCAIGRLLVLSSKRSSDLRFVTEYINTFVDFALENTGVPQLTAPQISKYTVALPPTKAEQTAIASVLSDMDAEIAVLETKVDKARQVKQGMMQELLTGRIRLV